MDSGNEFNGTCMSMHETDSSQFDLLMVSRNQGAVRNLYQHNQGHQVQQGAEGFSLAQLRMENLEAPKMLRVFVTRQVITFLKGQVAMAISNLDGGKLL